MAELTRQIRNYRRGETAFMTLVLVRHGDLRALGQVFLWIPAWRVILIYKELRRRLRGGRKFSFGLFWVEYLEYFAGPWGLWRAHRIRRRIDRHGGTAP